MSYIIFDEKNGVVVHRIADKPTAADDDIAVRYYQQTGADVSLYEHVSSVTPERVKRHAQRLADEALKVAQAEATRIQKWNDEQTAKRRIEDEAATKEAERLAKEREKAAKALAP